MADKKTSDEDAAGDLTGAELLRITQGGASKRVDLDTVRDYALAGVGDVGNAARRMYTQAPQAVASLRADGLFRDPFRVGSGALEVGAIATITDNTAYNAWPAKPTRLHDGRLLLVYTTGAGHHDANDGKAVGKLGTENPDGTITWGSEFTIFDDPSLWTSGYGATQLSTGRVIVSLWRDNYSVSGTGRAGYVYSDDACATWSALQDLHTASGFTDSSFAEAECVELPNGDVLIGVGGIDTGQTYLTDASFKVLRSTDGGTTFGDPVMVSDSDVTGSPVFESVVKLLSDGSLLCIHRVGVSSGAAHLTQRSTDGGETWGAIVTLPVIGYGKPNFIQASSGTLILCTREDSSKAVVAHTSLDLGVTWSAAQTIDDSMFESEYAAPFELANGTILVVYGHQPSSSFANCDIKGAIVTELAARLRSTGVKPLTDGATIDVDASGFDNFRVTLGGDRTLANPTGVVDGQVLNFRIEQDGTGSRLLSFGSKYKFAGGVAPALSTAASARDFMSCQYDATDDTLFCVLGQSFA